MMPGYVPRPPALDTPSLATPSQPRPAPAAREQAPAPEPPSVLGPHVLGVLRRTPVDRWHCLAVLTDAEGAPRIMTRGELAAMLAAADLPSLAREARSRRVERGDLLTLRLSAVDGPLWRVVQFGDDGRLRR